MIGCRPSTAFDDIPTGGGRGSPALPHGFIHSRSSACMPLKRIRRQFLRQGRQSFVSLAPMCLGDLPMAHSSTRRVSGYNSKRDPADHEGAVRISWGPRLGWGSSSTFWLAHDIRRYYPLAKSLRPSLAKTWREGCFDMLTTSKRQPADVKKICCIEIGTNNSYEEYGVRIGDQESPGF